jgi:group I intron endonuclease
MLFNINTNPLINDFKKKIINNLSENTHDSVFNSFVLNKLSMDRLEFIKTLGLTEILQNNKSLLFKNKAPDAFTKMYQYNKLPGIYWLYSILPENSSYIGHTTNLYQRLTNHKNYALKEFKRHPKLYNYINKYGWEVMEIRVITLLSNSELLFRNLYPNYNLTDDQIKVLNQLTKYELLITEQYCIDILKPSLNLDLIVNVGGLTNKGASGYVVPEEELFKRSQNLMGRTFSEETIKLIKDKMTGRILSKETRDKMSLSSGGVKVYLYSSDYKSKVEYNTKSELASNLNISLRTLNRRLEDSKPIIKNNQIFYVSLNPNLK